MTTAIAIIATLAGMVLGCLSGAAYADSRSTKFGAPDKDAWLPTFAASFGCHATALLLALS